MTQALQLGSATVVELVNRMQCAIGENVLRRLDVLYQ
jgi:hypothetical protein